MKNIPLYIHNVQITAHFLHCILQFSTNVLGLNPQITGILNLAMNMKLLFDLQSDFIVT